MSILKVDNGYVVKIKKQGESLFKTRYETPIFVFATREELTEFLAEFFADEDAQG